MAAFRLPIFPLLCNVWSSASTFGGPPRLTPICQLRHPEHIQITYSSTASPSLGIMAILFPPLTDIRDQFTLFGSDGMECPAGSGRYYEVISVDDVAKGFANEYRLAIVSKNLGPTSWPVPTP